MPRLLVTAFLAALFCVGCSATHKSIYREFDIAGNEGGISLDAKQRVILTKKLRFEGKPDREMACAEPSPDALQAISGALAAELITPEGIGAGFSGSSAEGALSIGLRTQTIQLLRDAMYRLCEGYFNSALDGPEFKTAHMRYQNTMVGLLAIEQLTGAVRPAFAAIGSDAKGSTKVSVTPTVENAEGTETAGQGAGETATEASAGSASFSDVAINTNVPSDAVAQSVQQIVNDVIYADYTTEFCLTYLRNLWSSESRQAERSGPAAAFCTQHLTLSLASEEDAR